MQLLTVQFTFLKQEIYKPKFNINYLIIIIFGKPLAIMGLKTRYPRNNKRSFTTSISQYYWSYSQLYSISSYANNVSVDNTRVVRAQKDLTDDLSCQPSIISCETFTSCLVEKLSSKSTSSKNPHTRRYSSVFFCERCISCIGSVVKYFLLNSQEVIHYLLLS